MNHANEKREGREKVGHESYSLFLPFRLYSCDSQAFLLAILDLISSLSP